MDSIDFGLCLSSNCEKLGEPEVVLSGTSRDRDKLEDFDELLLENDVCYQDALYNGIEGSECENIDTGEITMIMGRKLLENCGSDREWAGKAKRLGIAPIHVSKIQNGGRRVEFDCIHDEMYETLPEFVSISSAMGPRKLCELKYKCGLPVAAVEIAPGAWMPIFDDCMGSSCACKYILGGEECQLKPCQFAKSVLNFCENVTVADMFVLTGVCRGFRIVDHGCKASYFCDNYKTLVGSDNENDMTAIINGELREGKIRRVKVQPRCVHALGSVKKPDKSIRPITDCSKPDSISINNHMKETCKKFKYKSLDDVVKLIDEQHFCAVSDISAAYRTVCLIPSHRDYQGISWDLGKGQEWLQDLRVCFGLACAPYLFTLISDFVVKIGAGGAYPKCVNYLDDFFVTESTKSSCEKSQDNLCGELECLGFVVKKEKQIKPATCVKYLGILVDTNTMTLSVGDEKLSRVKVGVAAVQVASTCKRKKLEQLAGLLAHCATVVKGGRTYTRRIYNLLKDTAEKEVVKLDELVKLDLSWWHTFMGWFNGKAKILRESDRVWNLGTDASNFGFGAHSDTDHFWGTWNGTGDRCPHEARPPTEDYYEHINEQELWPVIVGCQRWGLQWKDSVVIVSTDNTQVQAVLNTGRSSNATAMAWARELFWVCTFYNIQLKVKWVAGLDNILADSLSRLDNPDCVIVCGDKLPEFASCCYRAIIADGRMGGCEGSLLGRKHRESL